MWISVSLLRGQPSLRSRIGDYFLAIFENGWWIALLLHIARHVVTDCGVLPASIADAPDVLRVATWFDRALLLLLLHPLISLCTLFGGSPRNDRPAPRHRPF
jgi:hypothetical protein